MLADTSQIADELEKLRQGQKIGLYEHDFSFRFPSIRVDIWGVLGDGGLVWVEILWIA